MCSHGEGGLLGALQDGAQALWDLDIEGLDPDQIRYHLRSISGSISLLELIRTRNMEALEKASAHDSTGAADIIDFFSMECGLTPEAVNDRVTLARQLDQLPSTVEKLASGEISFDTATLVARNTAKMRPADRPAVEAGILEAASRLPPGQLRHRAEEIVATVDAEPLRRDANRARERRSLKIGPDRDGLATISGYLTSVSAAELRAALEPHMRPADRNDTRSAVQRRHDALQELCKSSSGERGRSRPHVLVVAGVEAMMGEAGPPPLLQGLVPISQAEFAVVLEDADISVALKDLKGNLAYVGRKSRVFSAPKRRGVVAISPTCAFAGCTRPAVDCTGHHIIAFSQGGETTIETEASLPRPPGPGAQGRLVGGWRRQGWIPDAAAGACRQPQITDDPGGLPEGATLGEVRARGEAQAPGACRGQGWANGTIAGAGPPSACRGPAAL